MTKIALPEYHQHEEFQNRSAKLAEIRQLGIDPYPHRYSPTHTAESLTRAYESQEVGHSEEAAEGKTLHLHVSGRLVLFRAMGKNAFGQVQDATGRVQIMFNRDLTTVEGLPSGELTPLKFIEKKLDLGDIIGIEGHLFRTQKGELTVFAKKVTLLCKSLLPLPDKHAGLADKGTLYRKRWLDLITHEEVVKRFQLRSEIIKFIRTYLDKQAFLEVETAVLQNVYGGAAAQPFVTKLNALDQEMFMRISLEIPLKKLLVAGIDRVFEISKVFRNEGIDRTHNPEFTELELYAANWDYNDLMVLIESMIEALVLKLYGKAQLQVGEHIIDFKTPWKRLSMKESIKQYGAVDVDALSDKELREILKLKGDISPKEIDAATRGQLIALAFEEFAEKHLIQPHHIIDHPIETTPLCKLHRDPKLRAEGFVERFESFVAGAELCNSYSELNDPELQRELLVQQAEKRLAGDEEAVPLDEEFIEAICQGMPPAAGLGMGVDRLVMLLTNSHSIRDVIFFPLMRPEE